MSVAYNTTLKNTRLTAVVTAVGATGHLIIMTSADAVLADISLANPCGTVTGGVLTLTAPVSDTDADATGTAAKARITDGSDDIVTGLTVTLTGNGGDIILNSLSIAQHQTVTLSSGSITHG